MRVPLTRLVRYGLAATMLLGLGCRGPVTPSAPLGTPFTLAPGDAVRIRTVRVEFKGVTGDSRCPIDAICIQGGDAIVHLRLTGAGLVEVELHTGDAAQASVRYGGLLIALEELQPYPFSSHTIPPAEYRATLRATSASS